jgi:Predicted transcriptional regulators
MNVSDYEVAKATQITKSTFSDWKTGRSNPKIDKLQKIAAYFGVSLEYFLEE